jgi:hypothetical protein
MSKARPKWYIALACLSAAAAIVWGLAATTVLGWIVVALFGACSLLNFVGFAARRQWEASD